MLRVLFIILAVVSIALAIVLGLPTLYLLALALLIGAGLLVTMNMRRRHKDVPETFMQAPEQPAEDLASLGILDIKPKGDEVESDPVDPDAPEEVAASPEEEAETESQPAATPDRSVSPTAAQAHVAGVSKARQRPPRARIMVSEAASETKADVLIPCLRSLRASLDAYTVCLLRQEGVPLRYDVEVMVSQNSYARNGGSYSAKEPMLSGHKALVPVVYPRVGPNGFHKAKLGYYAQEHEQIKPGVSVVDHAREVSTEPDLTLRSLLGHFLLADKVDQDAGTLSGGEKTKLALAQLVLSAPNVMLLDEPTNNLDPQAKEALLEALRLYPGSVVLVSHDTDFVAQLGVDRAILMPEGESSYFDESMLDLVALA